MNKYILDFKIPIPNIYRAKINNENVDFSFFSRLPELQKKNINGYNVIIKPYVFSNQLFTKDYPNSEFLQLLILVEGSDVISVINTTQSTIECLIDSFAFQIQIDLNISRFEVIKIKDGIKIGDEVNMTIIAEPNSMILPKFYKNNRGLGGTSFVALRPTLDFILNIETRKEQLILNWYTKSFQSPYLLDRLIYLLIIVDILSKPYKVGPYRTTCEHDIANCPECMEPILKDLIGVSAKEYLVNQLGFNNKEAAEIWKIRQIIHGQASYNFNSLFNTSIYANRLFLSIGVKLKEILGISISDLPKFGDSLPVNVAPTMIIEATIKATDEILMEIELFKSF